MKRIITIVLVLTLVLSFAVFPASAAETAPNVTYLEDGSYIVTEIEELDFHGARSNTKVGSKSSSCYSPENVLQWKMTVTGEFQYDGSTSSCTYASGVTTIYMTNYWTVTSESASAGSNSAYYTVNFKYTVNGVVMDRPVRTISLTCDEDGNLS